MVEDYFIWDIFLIQANGLRLFFDEFAVKAVSKYAAIFSPISEKKSFFSLLFPKDTVVMLWLYRELITTSKSILCLLLALCFALWWKCLISVLVFHRNLLLVCHFCYWVKLFSMIFLGCRIFHFVHLAFFSEIFVQSPPNPVLYLVKSVYVTEEDFNFYCLCLLLYERNIQRMFLIFQRFSSFAIFF